MGLASPRYIAAALTQLQAMATATAMGSGKKGLATAFLS